MLTGYGILQADLHNLPEALSSFESALDYCEELRDPIPYCSVWINIAGTFASAALPDLAVGAAKIAMEYAEGIEDQSLSDHFAAFSLSNIAYAALYSSAYALGLRSARRANTIFRGMPVLAQAPHGQTNIANRINAFCLQARHLLRVGSVSDAKVCVESAKQVLAEFGAPTRATHIATGAEALVLVYAGRIEEGISILDSALANARPLTSEFVVDVLRDLVESNNVANRCEDAALYMHELGRRMQRMHSDSTLFHQRRHLGRISGLASHPARPIPHTGDALQRSIRRSDHILGSRAQFLEDLCAAAELHDDPSGRHAYRVAELARCLALKSGSSQGDADAIARGARLHDVGKVGVPPEILRKPGPLDAVETEIMRSHSTAGAEILASAGIEDAPTAISIARHHHEWWSGAGYPGGLVGESIPLAARITSLAEAFDAMTHDRPYRSRLPVARALELIAERAGRQFDPRLSRLFCELVEALLETNASLDTYLERDVPPTAFPRTRGRVADRIRASARTD